MSTREFFRKVIGIDPEQCAPAYRSTTPGQHRTLDISHNVILYLEDVTVSFDGTNVHFSYGIPRGTEGLPGAAGQNGADGQPGPQGPPGEVTTSQLSSAIATTAQNPSVLSPMSIPFSDPPTQAELLQVQDKYNELLSALLRTP